jgi:DNA polymerase-3 subunit delta'
MLLGGPLLAIRDRVNALLERLPAADPLELHALGDKLDRADDRALDVFVETIRDWLSARLAQTPKDHARLARVAETWDRLDTAAREAGVYNLDKKPVVFAVFGWLAETARG